MSVRSLKKGDVRIADGSSRPKGSAQTGRLRSNLRKPLMVYQLRGFQMNSLFCCDEVGGRVPSIFEERVVILACSISLLTISLVDIIIALIIIE